MLRHTLLITLRKIKRNRTSFIINTLGLSTGLAALALILLWINDEMKVDNFHAKSDSIYQVMTNYEWDNKIITMENTPLLLADALVSEFPEINSATSTSADFIQPEGVFQYETDTHLGKGIFASQNFFDTFSFQLLHGRPNTVLSEPDNVVISERLAKKIFTNAADAIGKTLTWDYKWSDGGRKRTLIVSGVFEDLKSNTTFEFDALLPAKSMVGDSRWAGDWSGGYAKTYLVLEDQTNIANLDKKIAKFLTTKIEGRDNFTLFTQKYATRYLKQPYEGGVQVGGRIVYVRLFIIIALFVLCIACINFINLSTAQASKRMKEIGVKKVVGGKRKSLIYQFLGESVIMAIISALVASIMVVLVLSKFNVITGKQIQVDFSLSIILVASLIVLLTGLIAGAYPAFYLSKFKPVSILKGKTGNVSGEVWVRKGLVIFQFALSVIFIVAVFVIHNQIDFMMNKNLGYDRDNVLTFKMKTNYKSRNAIFNELSSIAAVEDIAFMSGSLFDGTDSQGGYSWNGLESNKKIMFQSPRIGYNLIETLGIELAEGRSFSKSFQDDDSKIIINESARRLMDLDHPIGTIIDHGSGKKEIIGVVEDFQYGSLHKALEPLILRFRPGGTNIAVRLKSGNMNASIDQIETIYERFQPGYPFEFSFLDAQYQKLYEAESRVSLLSKLFAFLVILISCLGLFGLVAYTAQQRSKEIGIRKVLGASVSGILKLLSKDFLKPILIAILIAVPLAWIAMQYWLEDFAYRIEIDWMIFVISGATAMLIAMVTVAFQALKAAIANPVDALRSE